ncbi:MAG: hypothetical protein JKX83_09350 [Pseudomonadales bacterium]|nr:hypothetical protein [Pseudomonadales bacterium]
MKQTPRIIRRVSSFLIYAVLFSLIFISLLTSLARLSFDQLSTAKELVEVSLSKRLNVELKLGTIDGDWEYFDPIVRVSNLRLLIPDSVSANVITIDNAEIRLNSIATLLQQKLVFSRISIRNWKADIELKGSSTSAKPVTPQQVLSALSVAQSLSVTEGDLNLVVDGSQYQFSKTSLLRSEGDKRQKLQLNFVLNHDALSDQPAKHSSLLTPSKYFRFILDLENTDQLNGFAYAELPTAGFDLIKLAVLKNRADSVSINTGTASGRAWFTIEAGAVSSLKSNLYVSDLSVQAGTSAPGAKVDGGLDIQWYSPATAGSGSERSSVIWLSGMQYSIGDALWQAQPWVLDIKQYKGNYRLSADGAFIELQPLALSIQRVLGADHEFSRTLKVWALTGVLQAPRVEMAFGPDKALEFSVLSDLNDVGIAPWNGVPGIAHLNGYVGLNRSGGIVGINSDVFGLHFPALFDHQWIYQKASGEVLWSFESWGVLLGSDHIELASEHANATGAFRVQLPFDPKAQEPQLSLLVGLTETSLEVKSDYLTNAPAVKDLMEWLDSNLRSGVITQGGVLYQGVISKKPPPNSSNLQLMFEVADLDMTFDPQWPALKEMQGSIWLDDDKLIIESPRAVTNGVTIENIVVSGEAIDDTYLVQVSTDIQSEARPVLGYLRKTPLLELNPELINQLTITGDLSARVSLDIPIQQDSIDIAYNVDLTALGNDLALPDYAVVFSKLRGGIKFSSETGITSEQFSAIFLDQPVSGRVDTLVLDGTPSLMNVELDGSAKLKAIHRWFDVSQFELLTGETEYRASLSIDFENPSPPVLQVISNLVGVTSEYPQPINKDPEDKKYFRFSMALTDEPLNINFGLDQNINLSLQLTEGQAIKGQLKLGEGLSRQPQLGLIEREGITIEGTLDKLDVGPWVELLTKQDGSSEPQSSVEPKVGVEPMPGVKQATTATSVPELASSSNNSAAVGFPISSMDLKINNFRYGDLECGETQLNISTEKEGVLFKHRCDLSSGQSFWYFDQDRPFLVELFDIHINFDEESEEESFTLEGIDPSTFPDIDFSADHVLMNDRGIGAWKWKLRSDAKGAEITDWYITSDDLKVINGRLSWQVFGKQSSTQIRLKGVVKDTSRVMHSFGLVPGLSSENGAFDISLNTNGRPDQATAKTMTGNIYITSKKGRFLAGDASGAFDVFNLLNFDGLIGRLSSDFASLGGDSMRYKRIGGDVVLENGIFRIKNTVKIEGISANFELSGLYYVENDRLDMSLVVTLPLSKNLPWYGILVGGLPAAAAIFIASKVFEDSLKIVSSARYRITGSIENPVVKLDSVFETETNSKIMELYEQSDKTLQRSGHSDEQLAEPQ